MTEEQNLTEEIISKAPEKSKKFGNIPLALSLLSLLFAISALTFVFVSGKKGNKKDLPDISSGKVTIAWINTDTIWAQYAFVADMKTQLAAYEKNLQDKYAGMVSAFQKEYDDYLKKGTSNQLTLDQQKKKEEELAKKQQSIQEMDAQLSQQLVEEKTARNMEVHDSIVNFIARFNKDQKYTFIMERSYGGGILWANDAYEITDDVLKGLNKAYETVKQKREIKAGE
jgi:outer membrane protein